MYRNFKIYINKYCYNIFIVAIILLSSCSSRTQSNMIPVCDTITDTWGKQIVGKTIFLADTNGNTT